MKSNLNCSKEHELVDCEQFRGDEIQARWNIVKQTKLCHVCLKSGHMRGTASQETFVSVKVSGGDTTGCYITPPRKKEGTAAQEPHPERQKDTQTAQVDIQHKEEGAQTPNVQERVEQYATVTEAS